jgi:hypothetical protein
MDTRVSNVDADRVSHTIDSSMKAGLETYMIDFETESLRG